MFCGGMNVTGICFNIQRYSVHDGPGIRTTVFLKGCPLSCGWCHNPEGRQPDPEILFVADRCMACGECAEVCPNPPPVGAGDGDDRVRCQYCGRCAEVCVTGARRLVGRQISVEDLLEEVERDRPFYEESGGGVTFSGGEPLLQGEFLLASLQECRETGLHTAVDTSGCAESKLMLQVAGLTDLILYDLKIMNEERHQELLGAPLGPILDNLRALDEAGMEIWIRFPLIPGLTDEADNLEALGKMVRSLKNTRRIHLLPFHRTAADKYTRLGRTWSHGRATSAPKEDLDAVISFLGRHQIEARIGG
jgi:pyruvate formate lyase activating enzyme